MTNNITRAQAEERFCRELRDYILDTGNPLRISKYQFGGLSNLCTSIATICEQEAANQDCEDYLIAAQVFREAEETLDLYYEPGPDAVKRAQP